MSLVHFKLIFIQVMFDGEWCHFKKVCDVSIQSLQSPVVENAFQLSAI